MNCENIVTICVDINNNSYYTIDSFLSMGQRYVFI